MAHFGKLDAENNVLEVIVINNEDCLDSNGNESEEVGIMFCQSLFGVDTIWKQTSYNDSFRKQMAEAHGGKYDPNRDEFVQRQPYPSWTLDADNEWQPPSPQPEDGNYYGWDEESLQWVMIEKRKEAIFVAVDGEVVNP